METSCQRAVLVAKDEAARRGLPAAVQCDPVQVTEVALFASVRVNDAVPAVAGLGASQSAPAGV